MLDGWPIDSPSRALADVEDMLGLLVTWPTWARELILKKGLSNEERNTLTWFTLGNRLPPLTLARYLHLNGSLNDERAYKDIVRTFRLFLTGTNDKNFLYWDLGDKQLKPVGSATIRDAIFWEPAIVLLEHGARVPAPPPPPPSLPLTPLTQTQKDRITRNRAAALQRLQAPPALTQTQRNRIARNRAAAQQRLQARRFSM